MKNKTLKYSKFKKIKPSRSFHNVPTLIINYLLNYCALNVSIVMACPGTKHSCVLSFRIIDVLRQRRG